MDFHFLCNSITESPTKNTKRICYADTQNMINFNLKTVYLICDFLLKTLIILCCILYHAYFFLYLLNLSFIFLERVPVAPKIYMYRIRNTPLYVKTDYYYTWHKIKVKLGVSFVKSQFYCNFAHRKT